MDNNKNYWKTGVIVTLIFLIGYLAGIGTLMSLRYERERNRPDRRNPAARRIASVLMVPHREGLILTPTDT